MSVSSLFFYNRYTGLRPDFIPVILCKAPPPPCSFHLYLAKQDKSVSVELIKKCSLDVFSFNIYYKLTYIFLKDSFSSF